MASSLSDNTEPAGPSDGNCGFDVSRRLRKDDGLRMLLDCQVPCLASCIPAGIARDDHRAADGSTIE